MNPVTTGQSGQTPKLQMPEVMAVDASQFGPGTKWVLYGAGGIGLKAAELLLENGAQVVAFLDRNASPGQQVMDVPVLHPQSAAATSLRGLPFLVTVFNFSAPLAPIFEQLSLLEPEKVVAIFDFYEALQQNTGNNYWLTGRRFYSDFLPEMQEAWSMLADDLSREVFKATLELRLRGNWQPLEALRDRMQYFPPNVELPQDLYLVDCGACVGETAEIALLSGRALKAVYAFEPDAENFGLLLKNLQLLAEEGTVVLWPCGAWSTTTTLQFSAGTGASSHLDGQGTTSVPVVALDHALLLARVNYLKMDVEGAELEVLEGAKELLARERPSLAVCVYHQPDHLWAILLQLGKLISGYRYYLRTHQYNGFDLVLYGVPENGAV